MNYNLSQRINMINNRVADNKKIKNLKFTERKNQLLVTFEFENLDVSRKLKMPRMIFDYKEEQTSVDTKSNFIYLSIISYINKQCA